MECFHRTISKSVLPIRQQRFTTSNIVQIFPATSVIGRPKTEIHYSSDFGQDSWPTREMAGYFANYTNFGFWPQPIYSHSLQFRNRKSEFSIVLSSSYQLELFFWLIYPVQLIFPILITEINLMFCSYFVSSFFCGWRARRGSNVKSTLTYY